LRFFLLQVLFDYVIHMSWWDGFLLGFIQGITEWFPISSSGHLAIIKHLLGLQIPLIFDILLHISSLLVIVVVFWKDIIAIIKGILHWDKAYVKLVIYLIIASVPIAVMGLIFEDLVETAFNNMIVVGICFLITSGILLISRYPINKTKELNFTNVILIGMAQAAAILPGLSRSGVTNGMGLILGVKPKETGRFAFLLAIPAIGGSLILKMLDVGQITNIPMLIIGMITAFIFGILSLRFLLWILNAQKLYYFSIYCFIVGVLLFFI
jgi:undecaprenyl-diphosphatase